MALVAFLVNALLTPAILRLAHRFEWYDHQNARKIHTESTPRLGGVGIFLATVVAAIIGIAVILGPSAAQAWRSPSIWLILAGLAVMHGVGLYDDFVNLRAVVKLAFQIASALLVALGGVTLGAVSIPWIGTLVLPVWLAYPVTVLWIVAIANALNLIDGADGVAGGVSMIAALFFGLVALGGRSGVTAIIAFALVGALAAFLLYNFPPARIFMGDSGSLTIGFLLAVIPLLGIDGTIIGEGAIMPLLPVVTLLFVPIADTSLAIIRRLARGLPVHHADREHIHHRLIDRGFGGRRLLAIIYSGTIMLGFAAMAGLELPDGIGALVIIGVWVITVGSILALGTGRE